MKKCKRCGKEVRKLYGLFVPHLCKGCLEKTRKEQKEKGEVCGLCHSCYIDCCC